MSQWTLLPLFCALPFCQRWKFQVISQLHMQFQCQHWYPWNSPQAFNWTGSLSLNRATVYIQTSHNIWVTPRFKSMEHLRSQDFATWVRNQPFGGNLNPQDHFLQYTVVAGWVGRRRWQSEPRSRAPEHPCWNYSPFTWFIKLLWVDSSLINLP